MPYIWKPSGSNSITSPAISSFNSSVVQILVGKGTIWSSATYLAGVNGSTTATRYLGLVRTGNGGPNMLVFVRGASTTITSDVAGVFGSLTLVGPISFTVNMATGAYELIANGATLAGTVAVGTAAVPDIFWRWSGRATSDTPGSTGSTLTMASTDRLADPRILVDGSPYRTFVLPADGVDVPEIVNNHNGILRSPTGDDFEKVKSSRGLVSGLVTSVSKGMTPSRDTIQRGG